MSEFYKGKHTEFIERTSADGSKAFNKNLASTTKAEMDKLTKQFIKSWFGEVFDGNQLSEKQKAQIINSMTLFVFTHRNSKDDAFLKELKQEGEDIKEGDSNCYHTDFDILRDVCYKYSKKATERFFSFPVEAYFFVKYALSDDGQEFIENKPPHDEENREFKVERFKKDTHNLMFDALKSLQDMS